MTLRLSRPQILLFDIEGTVGSISFVRDTLFAYARRRLPAFIARNADNPVVREALAETHRLAGDPAADPVAVLLGWIDEDRKAPPLKILQGLVWEHGYAAGDFRGHLFADVAERLKTWKAEGIDLAVYSSGSVHAQHLYFGHSDRGDLRGLFRAHYDTAIGSKLESPSYRRIADDLRAVPSGIVFLSDHPGELAAAREAGLETIQVVREGTIADGRFPAVASFDQLDFPLTD
jgi:enolase-phosphatase E1